MGRDGTRLNGNGIGLENTVDYRSWTVNGIHQNYSQRTWTVVTVHDRSTVLYRLYHRISLVLVKTCILAELSCISCVCSLVFEWVMLRFNEINEIERDSWDKRGWTVDIFHHRSGPVIERYFLLSERERYFFYWTGWDWPVTVFKKNPVPFIWTGRY